jgi:drug/metabolite transporter (DMT)-like permease
MERKFLGIITKTFFHKCYKVVHSQLESMTIELNSYTQDTLKQKHTLGIVVLLIVTLIWGTSYPILKGAVVSLSPSVIFAIRFAFAALPFTPYLRFLSLALLKDGVLLGLIIFSTLSLQTFALETTSANHAAFIASFNVILVPLLGQFLGRKILPKTFFAAGLAILGIGVMCWETKQIVVGDFLMLGNALLYSIYILKLESITLKHPFLPLTAVQLWVIAIISLIWGIPDLMEQHELVINNLGVLLYLGFFDTAATIMLQVLAQQWVNAYQTALMYTLEPVFGAIFSFLLLGEKLGVRGLIGAGLVLIAMVFGQSKSSDFDQEQTTQINVPPLAVLPSSAEHATANIPLSLLDINLTELEIN